MPSQYQIPVFPYQRPILPYAAEHLPNNDRYTLIADRNQPVSGSQLDADANYLIDALNSLYVEVQLVAAGILLGADDPNNIGKFPITDGANIISWTQITENYFSPSCVPTEALQDGCATEEKLGAGSVTSSRIRELAVTNAHIEDDKLSFDKISDTNNVHFHLFFNNQANGVLSGTKILANSLPNSAVAVNTLSGTKIETGSLPANKLVANSLTRDQLAPVIQMPIGMIVDWAGAAAPSGFLLADGTSTHLIATYPALYAVLGTTYGGDGVTTFGVPDTRGRALFGINPALASPTGDRITGVAFVNGTTGGYQTHTLDISEIPPHTHQYEKINDDGLGASGGIVRPIHHVTDNTSSAGGGAAHNNMSPYMLMPKIIYAGV